MSIFVDHKALKHLLKKLKDVLISSPADGNVLTYEGATALWKNKPPGAPTGVLKLVGYAEGTTDCSLVGPGAAYMPDMDITVSLKGGKRVLLFFSAGCYCNVAGAIVRFAYFPAYTGGALYFPVAGSDYTRTFSIVLFGSWVPASDESRRLRIYWETTDTATITNLGETRFRRRMMVLQET